MKIKMYYNHPVKGWLNVMTLTNLGLGVRIIKAWRLHGREGKLIINGEMS